MDVKRVTLLSCSPFIVAVTHRYEVPRMLLLAVFAHLIRVRALKTDQGPTYVNPMLGHLGLTIIALVYVLIVLWQS
jgi:hypothetical protein